MAKYNVLRDINGLDDNAIASFAPSVFADSAHSSRASTYGFIPTGSVLARLRDNGFFPVEVQQQRCYDVEKRGFTRHMLRLRHADIPASAEGQHEVILFNSHDGTSSFRLAAGYFRFVCANGLWIGARDVDVRVYHRGSNVANDVIEGSYRIISECRQNEEMIEDMRSRTMGIAERIAFANQAIRLRFGERPVVTTEQVLMPRRGEDAANTEWQVFNRVQENLMVGGMYGRTPSNKTRKVRAITGLSKAAAFNARLWDIMQRVRDGEAAEAAVPAIAEAA